MKTKKKFIRKTMAGVLCALMLCASLGVTASAVKLENPTVYSSNTTITPDVMDGRFYLGSETVTLSNEDGFMHVDVHFTLQKTKDGKIYQESYQVYALKDGEQPITALEIELPYPEEEFYQASYGIQVYTTQNQIDAFNLQLISVATIMGDVADRVADDELILEDDEFSKIREQLTNAKGTLSDAVKAERDAAIAHLDALEAKSEENIAAREAEEKAEDMKNMWKGVLISSGISIVTTSAILGGYVWFSKRKKSPPEDKE